MVQRELRCRVPEAPTSRARAPACARFPRGLGNLFPDPCILSVCSGETRSSKILKLGKTTSWGAAVRGCSWAISCGPRGGPGRAEPRVPSPGRPSAGSRARPLLAPPRLFKAPRGRAGPRRAEPSRGECRGRGAGADPTQPRAGLGAGQRHKASRGRGAGGGDAHPLRCSNDGAATHRASPTGRRQSRLGKPDSLEFLCVCLAAGLGLLNLSCC